MTQAFSTRHNSSSDQENDSQRVAPDQNGSPCDSGPFGGIGEQVGMTDQTDEFIQRLYYQLLLRKTFSTPCGGEKTHKLEWRLVALTIQRVNILSIQTINWSNLSLSIMLYGKRYPVLHHFRAASSGNA